jgi:hypothetical protein
VSATPDLFVFPLPSPLLLSTDAASPSQLAFNNRIRQILMSSGSAPFSKIINKWNTGMLLPFRRSLRNESDASSLL